MPEQKPNCYTCKHRRDLTGDAHSRCNHPTLAKLGVDTSDGIFGMFTGDASAVLAAVAALNVSGDKHGIANGWFVWPFNFDPGWLLTCDGYEPTESTKGKADD